jgi:hypothetical protein
MRTLATSIILAAAVGLASGALAANPAPTSGQAGASATSPGGCQMGCGMMTSGGACIAASDERLAAIKVQLDLKPAQLPLWNAVANAAKTNAQTLPQGRGMMPNSSGGQDGPDDAGGLLQP